MKVLHVFTIPATAEAFFDQQFGYLVQNGHNITVVANAPLAPEFCARNKVTSKTAPIARRISFTSDIKAITLLVKEIRRSHYDVVVGHTPKGAMIAMIASLLSGTKKRIYYRHGLIYTTARGIKRTIFKSIERFTALCATNIVNVSPSLSKLAITDKLNSANKQTVIGQGTCGGIDTRDLFNPALTDIKHLVALKLRLGISENDFVIGFCGRLCRDKGIAELIEGFELFKKNNTQKSSKLLLIGRFDQRDALSEEIKSKIKNSTDIIYTGAIAHHIMPLYYSLMDVFVFPSYREGFGMCVLEASAMQIPILVSRSHGCIDSIRLHITGEYINLNASGIEHGIESMLDENKRLKYGTAGRQWVTDNFDYRVMWPQIVQFYKNIQHTD